MSAITPLHVYVRELNILIENEIERLKDVIALGLLEEHSEYRYLTGRIKGLRQALEYMDEADRLCKERIL